MTVYVVLTDYTGEFIGVFRSKSAAKRAAREEGGCHVKDVEIET